MSIVKSAGSRSTGSSPCSSAAAEVDGAAAAGDGSDPQAVAAPAAATSTAAAAPRHRSSLTALTGVLDIGVRADDGEGLVQLHIDLPAVVEGDLDLVVALLVADLGAGHPAAAGLGERGLLGA